MITVRRGAATLSARDEPLDSRPPVQRLAGRGGGRSPRPGRSMAADARAPAWQRMMTRGEWAEADLVVKLYVRITGA